MILNIPSMNRLSRLKRLAIAVAPFVSSVDLTVNSEILCGLSSLEDLRLENLNLVVSNPECLALPNLKSFIAPRVNFIIKSEGYENVLEMLADYSPNIGDSHLQFQYGRYSASRTADRRRKFNTVR